MAVKLSEADLPQLLPWLANHLPSCIKVHGELKSHLKGHTPDMEFFVDRWPHPQAVVARENPAGEQTMSKTGEVIVFGMDEKALSKLIKDPTTIVWNQRVAFFNVAISLTPVLVAVAEEKGKSVTVGFVTVLKAAPGDVQPIPVPKELKVQPISNAEVKKIQSTWKFSSFAKESYIQSFVEKYPSFCLVTKTGHYVGHLIGTSYGTMAFLYISPEFRTRGYAKVIISQLSQKYFDRGEEAYVFVEEDHLASKNLHKSLGFREAFHEKLTYVFCD
ncbi:hypothetical protein ACOMHN_045106 [Nucella lapillus]